MRGVGGGAHCLPAAPERLGTQGEGAGKGSLISYFQRFPVPFLSSPPPAPGWAQLRGGRSFLLGRAAWSLSLNPQSLFLPGQWAQCTATEAMAGTGPSVSVESAGGGAPWHQGVPGSSRQKPGHWVVSRSGGRGGRDTHIHT